MAVPAAAELAQQARRAGDAGPQCPTRPPIRTDPDRICRAETPTTGRSSATARCIGPEMLVTLMAERRMSPASSVNVVSPARSTAPGASRATSSHTVRSRRLPTRRHRKSLPMKCRATRRTCRCPNVWFPDRARRHGDERRSGKTVPAQQRIHARVCCLWKGKGEIGRAFRQVQHRTDAEVTIDRVNIEHRYRNMVCVGKPAALARALPRMFARFGGKGTRCRSPHACPRPVESDAHRRAGRQHEHGGAELAMQVDDEIIAVGTQPRRKPRVIDERRQRPGSDQSSRANSMTLEMAGLCRNNSAIAGVTSQSICADE